MGKEGADIGEGHGQLKDGQHPGPAQGDQESDTLSKGL